jgi:hypothetical protein
MTRAHAVINDPIIDEMCEIKRRLAAKFNYDVRAMLKDAQKKQTRGGRKVVTLSRKKGREKEAG